MYSPLNIIMGQDVTYDKHCKFIFGSYVESHDNCKITNYVDEQTVNGICLEITTNFQGSYKIFSLKTGACGYT